MYESFLQMFEVHLHSKSKEKQGKTILVSECEVWVKIVVSYRCGALGRRRGALGLRILCYFVRRGAYMGHGALACMRDAHIQRARTLPKLALIAPNCMYQS